MLVLRHGLGLSRRTLFELDTTSAARRSRSRRAPDLRNAQVHNVKARVPLTGSGYDIQYTAAVVGRRTFRR